MSWTIALLAWAVVSTVLTTGLFAALTALIARRAPRTPPSDPDPPPIAVIRPVKGLDADAERCHRSLFTGTLRPEAVLFVVEDGEDPAMPAIRAVCGEFPGVGRPIVAAPRPEILSGKIRNLMSGLEACDTALVAFCDADIELEPGHLRACVDTLSEPGVDAASLPTIYDADRGVGRFTMLVMTLDNATLGRFAARSGASGAAVGGLMVVRRSALDAIGGVAPLGDALADDLRLARLLHKAGHRVLFVDTALVHTGKRESARSHWLRHHRWVISTRTEAPALFWLQLLLLTPTSIALLTAALLTALGSPLAALAWGWLGVTAAARALVALAINRWLLSPHGVSLGAWCLLLPVAEVVYTAVQLITFLLPYVYWRGRWFRAHRWSGRIHREIGG